MHGNCITVNFDRTQHSIYLIHNFCFASPEIIGVKVDHRQTDKFFDNIYGGMWIFLLVKFTTSLLASLAGGSHFMKKSVNKNRGLRTFYRVRF